LINDKKIKQNEEIEIEPEILDIIQKFSEENNQRKSNNIKKTNCNSKKNTNNSELINEINSSSRFI
jgi:hypothetical protein